MKLDYIDHINEYGEDVVRLYEFDKAQAIQFQQLLTDTILTNKSSLALNEVDFIEARNCYLTLRIADEDLGIQTEDKINFFCDLTLESYSQMAILIEPFCKKETKGYQYLYDLDNFTDFLFSPSGT